MASVFWRRPLRASWHRRAPPTYLEGRLMIPFMSDEQAIFQQRIAWIKTGPKWCQFTAAESLSPI